MHFKWYLLAFVLLAFRINSTSATGKRRKSEEELNDNALSYDHKDLKASPALYSIIQEATVPTFIVVGLATLAAALNVSIRKDAEKRMKRQTPSSNWTNNLLRILGNVQKAVEKYQQLENEIVNELDQDFMKDFGNKSPE
ncbi:uncharacterized protein LOC141849480 isoform X2 [Brevipalpus obovatus]|uniref:uncharacterized protein LOC141849480 isoform X2 n=1 Tax=Brevipalpus obovatus TaxID=246614 RepID=UPI003D9F8D21